MAEIEHVLHNDATRYTTTSATYSSPTSVDILNTELTEGEWFMWFRAGIGGNTTTAAVLYGTRVYDSIAAAALADSTSLRNVNTGSAQVFYRYEFMDKISVAATPATYSLEFNSANGTAQAQITDSRSLAIKLDDLTADDYKWAQDTTNRSALTNASMTATSATVEIGDGVSDWVVFWTTRWIINSASSCAMRVQLDVEGTPRCYYAEYAIDAAAENNIGGVTVIKAPAAATTVTVEVQSGNSLNDQMDAKIFALRLDAFEQQFSEYTDGTNVNVAAIDAIYEANNDSDTSATVATEDWCAIAGCFVDADGINNVGQQGRLNYQIAEEVEVTLCGTLVNLTSDYRSGEGTLNAGSWSGVGNVPAVDNGETLSIVLDVREDTGTSPSYNIVDVALAAFTWELATSISITSVSGDDAWTDGDTAIPIVGTGFV